MISGVMCEPFLWKYELGHLNEGRMIREVLGLKSLVKPEGRKRGKLWQKIGELWAPLLFFLTGYAYDIYYLIKYGRDHLDSDMAAEMILSSIQNSNHSFLETNWIYSTEIKVIHMQWFYRLGLLLFPHNWLAARVIGMAIALLLLAWGFFEGARLTKLKQYAIWLAGFIVWPLGFWYQWQSIFGGYYLPYAMISIWSFWAVLKICNADSKKVKGFGVFLLTLLVFLSGMQGVRQCMVMYAPLLITAVLFWKNKKLLYSAVYAFVCNACGLLVNILVLPNYYIFDAKNEQLWGNGTNSWITSLRWYFDMFGFCQNCKMGFGHQAQDVPVFSFNGIAIGLGWVIGISIFASILYLLFIFQKLEIWEKILVTLCLSMLFVSGFVFTYIAGAMQYWQQTVPFGYVFLVIAHKHLPLESLAKKWCLLLGMAAFVCVSARGTCIASLELPLRAEIGTERVVDYIMKETDLRQGYAPFWLSNLSQELSNGELEMYCGNNLPNSFSQHTCLQKKDHIDNGPTEHYFIILYGRYENYENVDLLNEIGAECIYDDGMYCAVAVE